MLHLSSSSGIVLIWIAISLGSMTSARAEPAPEVRVVRVPDGGIQPQVVVDRKGTVHLLYYKGDAGGGDLFYVKRARGAREFSTAIRVNSQPGSAVAKGNIRGGQIALGGDGRLHVAWNGSTKARPKGPLNPLNDAESPYNGLPMLYSRSNPRGDRFERQRGLMQKTFNLDGGGTVAADGAASARPRVTDAKLETHARGQSELIGGSAHGSLASSGRPDRQRDGVSNWDRSPRTAPRGASSADIAGIGYSVRNSWFTDRHSAID